MIRIAAQVLTEAMRLNGSATAKLTHVCEEEPTRQPAAAQLRDFKFIEMRNCTEQTRH